MRLTLDELKSCTNKLFEMLRNRELEFISDENHDFYWTVLAGDRFNFQEEPAVAVGSLTDDIEQLGRLLEDDALSSTLDIERLASVFKLIADEI